MRPRAPSGDELPRLDLGPYRIERLLGRGGRGEVYEAWDERLRRRVAVKRLRSAGDPRDNRRRLRREARAAARLDHPAIVRIYDLLERPDGDWIVMERVAGVTLAEWLERNGPMAIDPSLELAGQLADGLAYAHRRGLVHRDLKTENVMISEAGGAKLLDFGLALDDAATRAASREETGGIVGTVRAMAPEQALGRPVDQRSDLFSFGVLLFETLAGRSPFLAPTVGETLARLCTHRPAALAELRPEAPGELATLVDRLLEKDPACRPSDSGELLLEIRRIAEAKEGDSGSRAEAQATLAPASATALPAPPQRSAVGEALPRSDAAALSAASSRSSPTYRGAVAGLLASAAILGLVAFFGRRQPEGQVPPAEPLTVAVLPVRSEAPPGTAGGLLPAALALGLERSLIALDGVSVVRADDFPEAAGELSTTPGATTGGAFGAHADAAVETHLSCVGDRCQITLRRLENGSVTAVEGFDLPDPEAYLAMEALGIYARRLFPEAPATEGPSLPRAEDLREYLALREGYESGDWAGREEELLDRVGRLRTGSPAFVEAHIFEAYLLRNPPLRNPERVERARSLLGAARRLAPQDPRPLTASFRLAVETGRLDTAAEALERLRALVPGAPENLTAAATLAWQRGRADEALELQARAVEVLPEISNFYRLASFQLRAGRTEEARSTLEELLRRQPEHLGGLWLLGQLELLAGSPGAAAQLYGRLAAHRPAFAVWANLGVARLLAGEAEGAAVALEAALELRPARADAVLNLADARNLQGRREEAEVLYRRVLSLLEEAPESLPGPPWQRLTVKAQALAHLGRAVAAAEAVRQALRLAPDEPQLAYEAALVYALIGERSSAIANGRRALELGVAAGRFDLPWFEGLPLAPEESR